MDILPSSSFVQKHAPTSSISPSSSLHRSKIVSLRIPKIGKHVSTRSNTLSIPDKIETCKRNSIFDKLLEYLEELVSESTVPLDNILSGNFAPVKELPPTRCTVVEGTLPPSLNGVYIRNGPNPQFVPRGPYHFFAGDGMLHAITISQGEAPIFCSRFVKTNVHEVERSLGYPVAMNFLSIFQNQSASLARFAVFLCRILTGKFDPRCGIGVANTNVAWFNRKLFAMYESDLPYEIKVTPNGDLRTLGRHELFGGGPFMTMTAHPKIDQETGEVFAFRCSFIPPFLTYFRISPDGIEQPQVPIFSQKKPSLVHDFAVTENYAIFPDVQIVMNPINFLTGKAVLKADPGKVPRLGILPRDAEDEKEMWWVEVPGLNAFHIVNAWEEEGGDTVMMVAQNVLGVEHFLESMDSSYCLIEKVEIDLKAKIVKRLPISPHKLDFIVINPSYHGRKNRYIYAAVGDPSHKFIGVVKLDLTLVKAVSGDCTVATHMYELGCYGSEPYFVPRDSNNRDLEEDDGYLVSYVHNENTNVSKFIVMDAKSTTLDIVASVKLPQRVPYGFHGTFVPDCNLKKH